MHPRPSRKRSQTIQKIQGTKGCGCDATIARTHDAHWSPTHASTSSLFGQENLWQHYRLLLLAPGALLMLDVSGARYCSSCQVLPSSLWLSFPCRVRHARLVRHQAAFLSHLKFCSLVILSSRFWSLHSMQFTTTLYADGIAPFCHRPSQLTLTLAVEGWLRRWCRTRARGLKTMEDGILSSVEICHRRLSRPKVDGFVFSPIYLSSLFSLSSLV
jgi:hypothetical protein